jgi:hypothetical protein
MCVCRDVYIYTSVSPLSLSLSLSLSQVFENSKAVDAKANVLNDPLISKGPGGPSDVSILMEVFFLFSFIISKVPGRKKTFQS